MWRAQCWREKDERRSSPSRCSLCPWEVRWQSRYGDHNFWSIIIVYFFLPDLSTTHLPLLPSLPAFTLSPAPSYCEHLPIILFPYSVLGICLNLLPGRSFPFQVSPATSLRGSVQLLPRLRMKAVDAGLPVRLQVFQPWTIHWCLHVQASLPPHFCFWVHSDRGCVCWFCREMKTSASPLVLTVLSLCVVSSCFFFLKFVHSFILSLAVSGLPSCKRAFSSCWREGAPLRRQRGLFLAVVSLAAELRFQAPGSCGCSTQARGLWPEGSRVWGAGVWARWLRRLALVALRQARSSLTRDWTRVPSSGQRILIHCNARELPHLSFVWAYWTYGYVRLFTLWFLYEGNWLK